MSEQAPEISQPTGSIGRPAAVVGIHSVQAITEVDLALLEQAPSRPSAGTGLKKIRARHHRMAQLLCAGVKASEVSRIIGCSQGSISTLLNSPAFQELILHYEAVAERSAFDFRLVLEGMTEDAAELLREELHKDDHDLSPQFLLEVLTKLSDRIGYGPVSRSEVNVHTAHLNGEDLRRMKADADARESSVIVNAPGLDQGSETKRPALAEPDPHDQGTGMGEVLRIDGKPTAQERPTEGDSSGGEGV